MKELPKYITDERTGLKYELNGDYYIIAGEDEPEQEPIGIWGQRHLEYIKEHKRSLYRKLNWDLKLYDYLRQVDKQAEEMYDLLIKQYSESEGITEQLKVTDQMEWVSRMNNIHYRATKFVDIELIYV